jgi:hypothetical protein
MVTGALDWPELPELPVSPPNPAPPNNCDNPSIPCACDEPGNMRQNRRSAVALTSVVNRVIFIWFEITKVCRPIRKTKRPRGGYKKIGNPSRRISGESPMDPDFSRLARHRQQKMTSASSMPSVVNLTQNSTGRKIKIEILSKARRILSCE